MRRVTSWAASERSSLRTWNRLKSGVEAALEGLWRQGAFIGQTAADAFYVKCDAEVNPLELAEQGRIRVDFGFALKVPADYIRMTVEQPSGDIAVYE
jgi:phage tail sheath protein FI